MAVSRRRFIQGAGVAGASAALGPRSVSAQSAGGSVRVTDFGARGDGNTDDTDAIRRAMNAASPGGTVVFPAGTYLVGRRARRGIHVQGNLRDLTFSGAGAGSTRVKMAGGHSNSHFVVHLEGAIGTMRFEGITFDGSKSQQSDTGLCLLSDADDGMIVARDCRFTSAYNAGVKFSGTCDADLQFCHFHNNGYFSNGGHAISPNQNPGKSRTYVRRGLFTQQGGVDIDTGHMTPDASWQTCVAEECYFRGSKRGVLKISSENARTTVRNSVMKNSGEIPVKMNPTSQDIGTIELDNVIIDGAGWPGIDLPCPGRLELNEVAIKNVNRDGQRGGGFYATAQNIQASRISIHNVNGGAAPAVWLSGCSGRIDELIYGGVSGIGRGAGVVKSARQGAPLSPSVVSPGQCGPRDGSASGVVSQPAGGSSQPASRTPPWQSGSVDISFEKTVDAVEDLGLDPDGGQLVDGALEGLDAGTLVQFPTGRYAMDSCSISTSNIGLVAAPGADPTIVPARPRSQSTGWLLQMVTGGDYVLSGFEFDFTERGYGGGITVFANEGDAYVGDIWLRGMTGGGANGLNVAAMSSEGTVVVSRYIARDGSRFDSPSHGLFVNEGHAGTLIVHNSEVWHWSDNGVYASSPGYQGSYRGSTNADRGNGEVHVTGGVFKNNNISNIRIGSTNSSIRDAVVHSAASVSGDAWESRPNPIMPRSGTEPQPVVNGRGIWITGRENITVENVDIRLDIGPASAAIAVRGAASDVTIRNTRIQMNIDAPALRVPGGDDPLTVEAVSFTGSSSAPAAIFRGRKGSTLDNVCLSMQNSPGFVGLPSEQISRTGGQCSVPSLTPSSTGQWGSGPGGQSRAEVAAAIRKGFNGLIIVMAFVAAALVGVVLMLYLIYREVK